MTRLVEIYLFSSLCSLILAIKSPDWHREDSFAWHYDCGTHLEWFDGGAETPTSDECARTCLQRTGCTHFSWSRRDRWCLHRYGYVNNKTDVFFVPGQICGIMDAQIVPDVKWDVSRQDDDGVILGEDCDLSVIESRPVSNLSTQEECLETCRRTSGCTHFVVYEFKCHVKRGRANKKDAIWRPYSYCGLLDTTVYTLQSEDSCTESDDGEFKLVKDTQCREYYSCFRGTLTFYKCPCGKFFDVRANTCKLIDQDFYCVDFF